MKKLLAIMLTAVMLLALAIPAFADDNSATWTPESASPFVVSSGVTVSTANPTHVYSADVSWEKENEISIVDSTAYYWDPETLTWCQDSTDGKGLAITGYEAGKNPTITFTVVNNSSKAIDAVVEYGTGALFEDCGLSGMCGVSPFNSGDSMIIDSVVLDDSIEAIAESVGTAIDTEGVTKVFTVSMSAALIKEVLEDSDFADLVDSGEFSAADDDTYTGELFNATLTLSVATPAATPEG